MDFLLELIWKKRRRQKRLRTLLENTRDSLFYAYGVLDPTEVQKVRALVYLHIAGMAFLNERRETLRPSRRKAAERAICALQEAAFALGDSGTEATMRLGELSADGQLREYRTHGELLTSQTRINAGAALEILYNTKGEEMMLSIMGRSGWKEPSLRSPGAAAAIVPAEIFGKELVETYLLLDEDAGGGPFEQLRVSPAVATLELFRAFSTLLCEEAR